MSAKDSTIQPKTFTPVGSFPTHAEIARTPEVEQHPPVPRATDRIISQPDPRAPDAQQPATLQTKVAPGTSVGVVITPELKKKLAPYLSTRPKRGLGYIIANG